LKGLRCVAGSPDDRHAAGLPLPPTAIKPGHPPAVTFQVPLHDKECGQGPHPLRKSPPSPIQKG
jgi:hypothetical protein